MKYGFTGSRVGPFKEQKITLAAFMRGSGDDDFIEEWHHGCCVGSDEFSHHLAKHGMYKPGSIVLHPPDNPKLEMKYSQWEYDNCIWRPRKPYLERDRDIVDETDELVTTPSGPLRHRVGGTWYTINYAIEVSNPVNIIWPDGSLERR